LFRPSSSPNAWICCIRSSRTSGGSPFCEIPAMPASRCNPQKRRRLPAKSAFYIVRILKGASPADLPIEEISKFDLVFDLRVARELKVEVPQELLYRADEVIR